MQQLFEKRVAWLQRNIPPDDIYLFTEQTLMAAMFFLHRWNRVDDIHKVISEDAVARKWVTNILALIEVQSAGHDTKINLDMESLD